MAKFKTGDKAWYFHSEWDGQIKMDDIELRCEFMIDDEVANTYNQSDKGIYHKTKRDALNTMSKRLKGFVDDESIDQK